MKSGVFLAKSLKDLSVRQEDIVDLLKSIIYNTLSRFKVINVLYMMTQSVKPVKYNFYDFTFNCCLSIVLLRVLGKVWISSYF